MGMLDQLDLDAVKRLYRADLPVPIDVLNLIHFKDEETYKWYGALTFPLLKAVGAEVGWMGAHVASFLGEPRAEELLVVRYPNQQTLSPRQHQSACVQAYCAVSIRGPGELRGRHAVEGAESASGGRR